MHRLSIVSFALFAVFDVVNSANLSKPSSVDQKDCEDSWWTVTISPDKLWIRPEPCVASQAVTLSEIEHDLESDDYFSQTDDETIRFSLYDVDDLLELIQQKAVIDSHLQMTLTGLNDKQLALLLVQPLTRWFAYYWSFFDKLGKPVSFEKKTVIVKIDREKVHEFAEKFATASPFPQPLNQELVNLSQCVAGQLQRFNLLDSNESIEKLEVPVLEKIFETNRVFFLNRLGDSCQTNLDNTLDQVRKELDAQFCIQE